MVAVGVAMYGIPREAAPPATAAGAPRPCVLRWKTHTRFRSFAPLQGSNPSCTGQERAFTWVFQIVEKKNGGGGGIRTLVTLYRPNGFRDRRIQPLCTPPHGVNGRRSAREKSNWRRVRDLNPGDGFAAYTISNRAPSATRTTLRSSTGNCTVYRRRCKRDFLWRRAPRGGGCRARGAIWRLRFDCRPMRSMHPVPAPPHHQQEFDCARRASNLRESPRRSR